MKHFTAYLLLVLASVVFVTLTSAPAYAVDGVVLINQNTSVSGLPGCGSTGFPIVICNPGSYRLSSNLIVPDSNTDAIVITVDNVAVDLNGFSIIGPNDCTAANPGRTDLDAVASCSANGTGRGIVGIFPGHFIGRFLRNISVTNGTVTGMGSHGIFIGKSRIENMQITSNGGNGIQVTPGAVITHNVIAQNLGNGIVTEGYSIIVGNTVSQNGGWGFQSGLFPTTTDGLANNTFDFNGLGPISGGTQTGGNVCTSHTC